MRIQPHRWARYRLERFLVGGAIYRLLFIAVTICSVVICGGTAIWLVEGDKSFAYWLESLWWCFLRLTDPGYLGDDVGAYRRTVSTVVTILGYVLFMGALIAIMTSWLHETLRFLERGLTPITSKRHIVILGWSERTPEILAELMGTNRKRLSGWLRLTGARRLLVAVLADEAGPEMEADLRQYLGRAFNKSSIILRGGNALIPEHLDRVNCRQAACIVVASGYSGLDEDEAVEPDARLMRIMLTVKTAIGDAKEPPVLVAPVVDAGKQAVLAQAYGSEVFLGLCSRVLVSRLLAQMVLYRGLASVFTELFAEPQGHAVYLRSLPSLVGARVDAVHQRLDHAVLLGLRTAAAETVLNPDPARVIAADDQLILIAQTLDVRLKSASTPAVKRAIKDPRQTMPRRLLILGRSRLLPHLLDELSASLPHAEIMCMSRHADDEFKSSCLAGLRQQPRVDMQFIQGDYLDRHAIRAARPEAADVVILLSTDRLASVEEADARTLLGYEIVADHLRQQQASGRVRLCVELRAPTSSRLLHGHGADVLIGGQLVSHALAQVTMRRDLLDVYDALFAADGPGLAVWPGSSCTWLAETPMTVRELRVSLAQRQVVLLGLLRQGKPDFNPEGQLLIKGNDQYDLIVLRG